MNGELEEVERQIAKTRELLKTLEFKLESTRRILEELLRILEESRAQHSIEEASRQPPLGEEPRHP
jgi:septal ring factor EnvC (AmiA/AmiB activator)